MTLEAITCKLLVLLMEKERRSLRTKKKEEGGQAYVKGMILGASANKMTISNLKWLILKIIGWYVKQNHSKIKLALAHHRTR